MHCICKKDTCTFEEPSDWLKDIAAVLDWAGRKTRWFRCKDGGGEKSWRLRGNDSPQ